jgi:hypothetical protein
MRRVAGDFIEDCLNSEVVVLLGQQHVVGGVVDQVGKCLYRGAAGCANLLSCWTMYDGVESRRQCVRSRPHFLTNFL